MLTIDDIRTQGFETVILAGVDVQGRLIGRRIPARRFLENPEAELPICTCALVWDVAQDLNVPAPFAGVHTGWHDYVLRPDLSSLRPYPGSPTTAIVMADSYTEEGEPLELDPRWILRRQVEKAKAHGFDRVLLASELEFYMFHGSIRENRAKGFRGMEPTTIARCDYSIVGQAVQEPFIAELRRSMEAAGIPIYACQAEYGFGQWEVNLEHCDALEMADRHVIYKAALKEMAERAGMSVTFMAKPVGGDMGSSCHFHCSMLDASGAPALPDAANKHHLNAAGSAFLAGLMKYIDDTAIFYAPYVNSYKRHIPDDFGGGVVGWGFDNRTVAFRVLGGGSSLRIEHRYAGADVNPYLAAGALLAAGLSGIDEGLDAGDPVRGNAYENPNIRRTKKSLGEALASWEASPFALRAFGKDVHEHYAACARGEWLSFLKAVTDHEVIRAFEIA